MLIHTLDSSIVQSHLLQRLRSYLFIDIDLDLGCIWITDCHSEARAVRVVASLQVILMLVFMHEGNRCCK